MTERVIYRESPMKELREENRRLREVVEFYAGDDAFVHVAFSSDPNDEGGYVSLESYGGKLARKVLAELEEKSNG